VTARHGARVRRLVAAVLALVLAGCSGSDAASAPADPALRAAVAMHAARDLVHFTIDLTPDGGALTVGIDDPFAARQIGNVGDYLHAQQRRLGTGDVSGLRALLGPDTPGLDALAAAPKALKLGYVELPDGGRLEIRSDRHAQAVAVHQLLNSVLVRFGSFASVGGTAPDTTTTTPGPSAPPGFLG
jgi:hypothetical protein